MSLLVGSGVTVAGQMGQVLTGQLCGTVVWMAGHVGDVCGTKVA